MKTPIDHLKAAPQPFDSMFYNPATLSTIGHNDPALINQPRTVLYYYRAAHLFPQNSEKYRRAILAARDRIQFAKPLSCSLYRALSGLLGTQEAE